MACKNDIKLQISSLRKKKGVTQEELAQHLGISFQAVSKWENGSAYPDITLLPAIASYFGESIETVLGLQPMIVTPSESYDTIKSQLSSAKQESLYEQAWNISAVLFEALATKGWKEYVPWELRNRLNDKGYHGWGTSINIETEGFSMMTGEMTIIGLTKGLRFPEPEDAETITDFLKLLADEKTMLLLLNWLDIYQQEGNNTPLTKSQIANIVSKHISEYDHILNSLSSQGWILRVNAPDESETSYQLNKVLMLMPVLALLKTLIVDIDMKSFPAQI